MGTIKDVYEIIKDIRNFAQEMGNTPFYDKVIEIQSVFFDLREENSKLKDQNDLLQKQLNELRIEKNQKDDVILTNDGYLTLKSDGNNPIIYCSHCYATKGLFVPMLKQSQFIYVCTSCGTYGNLRTK